MEAQTHRLVMSSGLDAVLRVGALVAFVGKLDALRLGLT